MDGDQDYLAKGLPPPCSDGGHASGCGLAWRGAADFDLVGGDQFESAEDGLLGDSGGAGQFPVPAVAGDGEGFIPRLDFRLTESGENDNAT